MLSYSLWYLVFSAKEVDYSCNCHGACYTKLGSMHFSHETLDTLAMHWRTSIAFHPIIWRIMSSFELYKIRMSDTITILGHIYDKKRLCFSFTRTLFYPTNCSLYHIHIITKFTNASSTDITDPT